MFTVAMPRIISELWVHALIRDCHSKGMMAFQLQRGDKERGGIVIKISNTKGQAYMLEQSMDFDGNKIWRMTPKDGLLSDPQMSEREIDEKIQKAKNRDPDLWILEVEDPGGDYQHMEPISSDF